MNTSGRSELVDITAQLVAETRLAFLLDDGNVRAWVPKSQTERNDDGTFAIPKWVAYDKGLV